MWFFVRAQGGYCHVIDDESSFKQTFGRDILAGMMELDSAAFGRKERRGAASGSGSDPRHQVAPFLKKWEPFDWTKALD